MAESFRCLFVVSRRSLPDKSSTSYRPRVGVAKLDRVDVFIVIGVDILPPAHVKFEALRSKLRHIGHLDIEEEVVTAASAGHIHEAGGGKKKKARMDDDAPFPKPTGRTPFSRL